MFPIFAGKNAGEPPRTMIHYYAAITTDKLERIPALQPGCWINVSAPFNLPELENLAEQLQIPLDFFTDSLDIDERARFDTDDDVKLIVVNTPILNEAVSQEPTLYITVPIGIILTPQHVLTITSYENAILRGAIENRFKNLRVSDKTGFVLHLLEQNVYEYLRCLKDINVRRNVIEAEVYESSRNQDVMKLLNLEKSLVYFVTALSSNAMMLVKLRRMDILAIKSDEEKSDLLEDIIVDNHQAQEMANIYSNILSNTMDALTSLISNNLNIVMQRLTLITLILMFPTVVASFYGMNVALPLQDHPYAFYVLLGIVVLLSATLAVIFRRKKMF